MTTINNFFYRDISRISPIFLSFETYKATNNKERHLKPSFPSVDYCDSHISTNNSYITKNSKPIVSTLKPIKSWRDLD